MSQFLKYLFSPILSLFGFPTSLKFTVSTEGIESWSSPLLMRYLYP